MSKSKHNGIDPMDLVTKHGPDIVRLFSLFKAPPSQDLEWDEQAISGQKRWLTRVKALVTDAIDTVAYLDRDAPQSKAGTRKTLRGDVSCAEELYPMLRLPSVRAACPPFISCLLSTSWKEARASTNGSPVYSRHHQPPHEYAQSESVHS